MKALLTLEIMLLVIILAVFIMVKRRESAQLRRQQETRAFTRSFPVQIVCGDCMGDDILPVRTFLTIYERCSRCGGNSYVIASHLAATMRQHKFMQTMQPEAETDSNRVVSIEDHLAMRDDRNRKIAI